MSIIIGRKPGGSGGGGGAPSGPAGGDLGGTYPNPTVDSVQANAVDTAGIQDDAVDNDKLANNSVDTPQLVDDSVDADKIDGADAADILALLFSGASVAKTSNQADADGGSQIVSWDTDSTNGAYDVGGYWAGGAPTRLTVPSAGKYRVSYSLGCTAPGELAVSIRANGDAAQSYGVVYITATTGQNLSGSADINLGAAEYVELTAFRTVAYTIDGTSNNRARMQIQKIG